jgi:putative hemolysin
MSLLLLVLGCVTLLILFPVSVFFSLCETALFSLSPVQIQHIGERNESAGRRIRRLMDNPALVLSTLLVGNTLVNFAIATLGYLVIATLIPTLWSKAVAIPLVTLLLVLFGEVAPKRVALLHAERLAPVCSRLLVFWMWILRPFNIVLTSGSKVFKKTLRRERRALSDDELLTVVEVGEEQGVLDAEEASMVDGIMRLSELKASDEMTPRVDMVGIDLDTPLEQQLRIAQSAHFRYLPAFVRMPDAIEGFVDVVQWLLDPEHDIRKAMFAPLFIPESMALDDLLVQFQKTGQHIACVLDEYGGTAGLITRGDIFDLIADPVVGPSEKEDADIQHLQDNIWIIDGTASLEEINHELELALEADDADRMAGWVTFHAGHLLQQGQSVEAQGCRATVRRMRRRRIDAVLLEVLKYPEEDIEEQVIGDGALVEPAEEEEEGLS